MLPTDQLEEEHEEIRKVLDGMEDAARAIERGETDHDVEGMLEFARDFADDYHHKKEEDILFEKMAEKGMPKQGSPVGMMLHEHDLMRTMLDGAEKRLEEGDPASAAKNLSRYVQTLREHIDKENNILYPMANKIMTQDDQEGLREDFDEADGSFADDFAENHFKFASQFETLRA